MTSCNADVELPAIVYSEKPRYTRAALAAAIQGNVVLEVTVLENGRPGPMRVLRTLDTQHGLDSEAVKSVAKWRFTPGLLRGIPVPVIVTVELSFAMAR